MFDSVRKILDKFINTDTISRFTVYSIEMERGENPEDVFYLCTLKQGFFVVFETDYLLNSLEDVAQEAIDIFEKYDLSPLRWLVRKDSQQTVGSSTLAIKNKKINDLDSFLVTDRIKSDHGYEVRYAVIEFTRNNGLQKFHPSSYGSTTEL